MQAFEMNLRYLIAAILFSLILGASTFSYKDAKNWGKQYPQCNGKFQSPVAMIDGSKVIDISARIKERLKFKDFYKLPTKMMIKNTGHAVEIKTDWSGEPPSFTGGPLHGKYVFEKTVFRWAQEKWTEWINYEPEDKDMVSQDMEMQLYFYKADWESFENAQFQKDGLAVFKLWLFGMKPEPLFKDLEKIIHEVESINSTAMIPPFPLVSFLDKEYTPQFLFHKGSLDYPPCSESVTWFETTSEIPISKSMVNGFRKIKLEGGDVSNVRPLQPLNNRKVMEALKQSHEVHED